MSKTQWATHYQEHGYLVVPNVLSQDELTQITSVTDRLVAQAADLRESNHSFGLEAIGDGERSVVKRIFDPIELDDAYRTLMRHPRILQVVTTLLGNDIELHHSKAHLKQPLHGSEIEWHQDFPFFPHTNFDLLAVMVAIDASTIENGCLRVIPGSHQWPPIDHQLDEAGMRSVQESDLLAHPGAGIKDVCVPAGGISVHHCKTFHGSLPNRSTSPRRSLILQYRAADNVQLGGRTDHAGYGEVVAGRPLRRARLEAGEFALPAESTDPRDYAPPRAT